MESLEKHVENALFSFKNTNAENLKLFCGVEVNTFKWILVLVRPYEKRYHLKLTFEDHWLLVLMKIRLGLLNKDIAIRFNIHNSRVPKIFRNWIPRLGNLLSSLIVWSERGAIRKNFPPSLKKNGRKWFPLLIVGEYL